MTLKQASRNLFVNLKKEPGKAFFTLFFFLFWKFILFWLKVLVAAGVFALAALYVFGGVADFDWVRMRSFCIILGFSYAFIVLCFGIATRGVFGQGVRKRKITPWIFMENVDIDKVLKKPESS